MILDLVPHMRSASAASISKHMLLPAIIVLRLYRFTFPYVAEFEVKNWPWTENAAIYAVAMNVQTGAGLVWHSSLCTVTIAVARALSPVLFPNSQDS